MRQAILLSVLALSASVLLLQVTPVEAGLAQKCTDKNGKEIE